MKTLITTFLLLPFSFLAQLNATLSQDVSMCVGDPGQTITFTGSNGTAPYTFTYTINGGTPQTVTTTAGNSVSVFASSAVAGTFNYQLTNVSDDLGANQAVNDNAFAYVNPLPNVNAGVDQSVCPGTSVTLSGSGTVTYTWNNGVTNGVGFVPFSTTIYTVTGMSNQGCLNTDQVLVTVDSNPIVYAGPDISICTGGSVQLNASGALTYNWSPSTGLSSSTSATVTAAPTASTTYTVTGISALGCMGSDQIIVTVIPAAINDPGAIIDSSGCNDGTIQIIQSAQTTNYSYTWMNGATTSGISNLAAGFYTLTIFDNSLGCSAQFTYEVPQSLIPQNCATLSGFVYFDIDENCSVTSIDTIVSNRMIVANPGNYLAITDLNGFYSMNLPVGNYTIEEIFNNPSFGNYCNSSYSVSLLNPTDSIGNNNFLDTIAGDIDVQAYLYTTAVVPGFSFYLMPHFYNLTGIATVQNATAWFTIPNGVTMQTWTYPHTISNDTVYYVINPSGTFTSQISFLTSTTLPLNSLITFCSGVETLPAEQIISNNIYCSTVTVVGAFDPNDKTMFLDGVQSDSTILLTDITLDYVIRFQNTGTAPAQGIYILDTINSTLEINTFQFVSSSHNCTTSLEGGNVLKFNFPQIMLPDSTNNEPESHGFVHYRIRQNNQNTLGAVINNTAYIYFDFNEAVVTNTTYDIIVADDLSLGEVQLFNVKLYPNPTNSILNIESESIIDVISVYTFNGQLVKQVSPNSQKSIVDLSGLTQGVYLVEMNSEKGKIVKRISVQ